MGKPSFWILKSEPGAYSYAQLVADKRTEWTGVRNFEARNNLRAMRSGDLALFYHSGDSKSVVGIARITRSAGPDPTAPSEDWASVGVEPVAPIAEPVSLTAVRANRALKHFPLIARSRLSVAPVDPEHFKAILQMGRTKLPR